TEYEVMKQIAEGRARAPSEVAKDYPPALEKVVMRALAPQPEELFASAKEMLSALEGVARELKLTLSTRGMKSHVEQLFSTDLDAWRTAKIKGISLIDHLAALPPRVAVEAEEEIDEETEA